MIHIRHLSYRALSTWALTLFAIGACLAEDAASADVSAILEPGLYRVEVRTELPNLGDAIPPAVHEICLANDTGGATPRGFGVLGANNPLGTCPASDVRQVGSRLAFRIACPGVNAASGEAQFDLARAAYSGRVAMKIGGKNMTFTEWQAGRRIGPCGTLATP